MWPWGACKVQSSRMDALANDLQRRRMVDEQIRRRGITDPRVLRAMEFVPRERFLPPEQRHQAFADAAVSLALGQTISQPYIVASMTAGLGITPHDRVLEIGTGSGYQTAILSRLAARVYTIERLAELQNQARRLLEELGFLNVEYLVADGTLGWPEQAPFDRIIVTAGSPAAPPALVNQLTIGGRMLIPIGGREEQTMTLVERTPEGSRQIPQYSCRFVKLIGDQGWDAAPGGAN